MAVTLEDLAISITRVEAKQDYSMLRFEALDKTGSDHETRIRRLERQMWTAAGFGGACGAVVGALTARLVGG
jgi:uncharacterized membrane protein YsdA (DUF1294 family)